MRRRMITAHGLTGLAMVCAGFAAAQGQSGGVGRGAGQGQGGGAMMLERIGMIDTDGDGLIQRAELTGWRETVFAAMDADGDNALRRDEYMAVQFGPGADPDSRGPRFAEMQAAKAAAFDAMDADGDGIVARAPFIAGAAEMFDAADRNGDGAIDPSEFGALHRGM